MGSSSKIKTCLTLASENFHGNSGTSFPETMNSEIEIRKSKYRLNRGHALLRKQFPKSIIFHSQKSFKRRYTFPGNQEHKILFKKRRRFMSVALPTKFLLGGNINDPLNLRSLEDEKINQELNAFTPASSPMPMSRHRTQVQVLIPPNIYDPLNLSTGEDIEFNLLTSKHRKRRRHRKSRREENENVETTMQCMSSNQKDSGKSFVFDNSHLSYQIDECSESEVMVTTINNSDEKVVSNKIVSPVVPQGSPAKFFKRYVKSFSKDDERPLLQKQISSKRRRSKIRLQHKADYIKFRANAEKFCYGNHVIRQASWNSNSFHDQRLEFLSEDLFCGKDVMDIGCNSGDLTLYIGKYWKPRKIIGIDIDKKLINIAQRKVRKFKSQSVLETMNFPQSMPALYGPLIKIAISNFTSCVFPSNIAFFEANYVPGCEEYLDSQKPEFDVILCLRVTKWIHLNFGDDGLKLAFKRMYAQLKLGGHLILEPQPWFTYSSSKRITPSIYQTYCNLMMRPDMFCDFLLSEVGFSACQLIGQVYNCTKVYRQPLYLLTKGYQTSCEQNIERDVLSTIKYHSEQWNQNSDEQGICHAWSDAEYLSS